MTTLREASTAPPGAHPVLLLCLQLPHTLQEPSLGPVQICSEACDGDDIRLQLGCWDMYIHLMDTRTDLMYVEFPQDRNVSIWLLRC